MGVAILAACSSDSDDGGAESEPTPDTTTAPEPEAEAPAATDPPADEPAPADDAPSVDSELQLQHVSLGFVSAYVLARGSEAAIVDTGTPGSGEAIVEALSALGLAPADVRHIVLTHEHGDHIGGLGDIEPDMGGATVYAGAGDIDAVTTSLALTEVADGDEVFGMGVVATPGHTPGSISLFDVDTGLLIAGDAINGDGAGGLLGPNEQFTSDMTTANDSVATLAALMPTTAAFGHGGPPVTDEVTAQLEALAALG